MNKLVVGKKVQRLLFKKKIQLDYVILPGCDGNVQQDRKQM